MRYLCLSASKDEPPQRIVWREGIKDYEDDVGTPTTNMLGCSGGVGGPQGARKHRASI